MNTDVEGSGALADKDELISRIAAHKRSAEARGEGATYPCIILLYQYPLVSRILLLVSYSKHINTTFFSVLSVQARIND